MNTIDIVGAGGIGCVLGYALAKTDWRVTMVDVRPVKLKKGAAEGITVDALPPLKAGFIDFKRWSPRKGMPILLCTKCYDNADVLKRLSPGMTLIPVQNGFDPQLHAFDHALEGVASFVANCPDDAPHARITRPGNLHLGPRGGHPTIELQKTLADAFRQSGLFKLVEVPAIEPFKYAKLMYNAAIAPVAAAAGLDNGQLLSDAKARRLFFGLLQENYRILKAAGKPLGKVGPLKPGTVAWILKFKWLARLLGFAFEPGLRGTYCSMTPDLPRGRTEIDYYNGHLVELACDIPCPLNRAAVKLIKLMEPLRTPGSPAALDLFLSLTALEVLAAAPA